MVLSILSCVTITTVNFKTFHCLKKKFESFLSHTQHPVYHQHQSTRFPYSGLHGNGTLQCVGFCVWLLSLSVTSSRFICVVACVRASSSWLKNSPLFGWTACGLFVHDGHLGCLHISVTMNEAAVSHRRVWWTGVRHTPGRDMPCEKVTW